MKLNILPAILLLLLTAVTSGAQPFIKTEATNLSVLSGLPHPRITDYKYHPGLGGAVIGDNMNSTMSYFGYEDFIIRLDKYGNTKWKKKNAILSGTTGIYYNGRVCQVALLSNGNSIITATGDSTNSSGGALKYMHKVVTLDSNGNLVRTRTWTHNNTAALVTSILLTEQPGGYSLFFETDTSLGIGDTTILFSHWMSFDNDDNLLQDLLHVDTTAITIDFPDSLLFTNWPNHIACLADNSLIFPKYDRLQKVTAAGSIQWTINIDSLLDVDYTYELTVYPTDDSGLVASAFLTGASGEHFCVFRMDKNGWLVDSVTLDSIGYGTVRGITQTGNGDFILNYMGQYYPVTASNALTSGFIRLNNHLQYQAFYPSNFQDRDYWGFTNNIPQRNTLGGAFIAVNNYLNSVPAYDALMVSFDSLYNGLPAQISGNTQYDHNSNCIPDAGDLALRANVVALTNTTTGEQSFTVCDSTGDYHGYAPDGYTYTVADSPVIVSMHTVCPATSMYSVNAAAAGSYNGNNFFETVNTAVHDLSVSIGPASIVSGSTASLNVYVNNYGPVEDTVFQLILDPFLSFVSSSPAPVSVAGSVLTYAVSSLATMGSARYIINVSNSSAAGTSIDCYVSAPLSTDIDPASNSDTLHTIVFASHISNVTECNKALTVDGNREIIYRVRFQNDGNHAAKNVLIVDTLDQHLDLSTFRLLSADPQMPEVSWHTGNQVLFAFNDIHLPDSNTDAAHSYGEVVFAIKPKLSSVTGDTIKSKSLIYFDYWAPKSTNQVINIISTPPMAIPANPFKAELTVSPIPAGNFVDLHYTDRISSVTITDVAGKTMVKQFVQSNSCHLDVSGFISGMYILVVTDADGYAISRKFIIQR